VVEEEAEEEEEAVLVEEEEEAVAVLVEEVVVLAVSVILVEAPVRFKAVNPAVVQVVSIGVVKAPPVV
jgi:hypothetical protein